MHFTTPQQVSSEGSQPKKPRRRKASKGTVQIKNSNGRLQLVFTYAGKRRYLSLGFEDSPKTRELAQMKANQIRLDMLSGNFDESMAKYKPEAALSVIESESSGAAAAPSLEELWGKFVEYKSRQCSPNTMYYVHKTYTGYLERMPTQELSKATEIRDFALKTIPKDSNAETFIFPGYSGGTLNTPSFRKTVWKPILEGLNIEYRKPYQTRHTFITLALENGLDAKDVAKLVGNSPEVIYRHYAGNKRELFMPEF